jgi:hypothetical protein
MREPGKKNNYLIPWGLKKMESGWNFEQATQAMNDMRKQSLSKIKELVKDNPTK